MVKKTKTDKRGYYCLILVAFCFFYRGAIADTDDFNSGLSEHQRARTEIELEKLRQRMAALRQTLQAKQEKKDAVSKALKEIETNIGERAYVLKKISRRLRYQRRELATLQQNKKQVNKKLRKQQSILARQVRAAYMIGQQEYLKLLLNQENPAAIGRTLTYYDYFHKARSHHIEDAKHMIEQLNIVKQQIQVKAKDLANSKQQQQQQQQKLEQDFITRSQVMAKLNQDINNKELRLKKLSQNEKDLQKLLQQIQIIMPSLLTEIDKRETFAKSRGRLLWPVRGKVKKLFGKSRHVANLKWHGVIISSPQGRDVKAVSHGRVAYADWLRGYGMLLILDHGDGYMTLYGQNQALYKETGDWVEEGEVIASVGRSGGQLQSGLYFEIRYKGRPTNPVAWCRS